MPNQTFPLAAAPLPAAESLLAVDRASAELRRGAPVMVLGGERDSEAALVLAAEMASDGALARLSDLAKAPASVSVTGRRAAVLKLAEPSSDVVALKPRDGKWDSELVTALADPSAEPTRPILAESFQVTAAVPPSSAAAAGIGLAKLARLLPAVVTAPVSAAFPTSWANERNLIWVRVADILHYQPTAAASMTLVSEARVPLTGAENARILAFRPADGGIEHLAVIIGEPKSDQAVLARLHSECFTGDLLGSLRCDCGDQLRGAIAEIAQAGAGVLLYLAQEGRGIGLVNKLRAYQLQDQGFDTLDANEQLGFDDDERIYLPAAEMLRQLGFPRVRLLTNNPQKVRALARHGITVEERVPHVFPSNPHNDGYLRTKAARSGHLF